LAVLAHGLFFCRARHTTAVALQHSLTTFGISKEGPAHFSRHTKIVSERRKQAVSIRMSGADVRKIKKLAVRLGVHDSDVVRFAVKTMLARLEPLHDPEARGRSVLPVFAESGDDLVRFFELDMPRLDTIINDGVEAARRVDRDDVALIAMHATQPPFAAIKLSELYSSGADRPRNAHESGSRDAVESLRRYLYEKYARRANGEVTRD
jgi:hypothetical protein